MSKSRQLLIGLSACLALTLTSCGGDNAKPTPPTTQVVMPPAPKVKVGIALGGGAAKGFAHIGVIKILESNGITPVVVSGTSAGSVVGALYASGMDAFAMQEKAFALDESKIRDVSLFSGGVIKGQKLQDYVNQLIDNRTLDRMKKPLAVVATNLANGERTVFVRGNTGQAVRASSSIPGVFEAVAIGKKHFVDGGVVSPVPVDAAKELGADFVIAVDISNKASGMGSTTSMLGNLNQSITIMGQKLGALELARADYVIRPKVLDIGAADFEQKNRAILEGERAAQAALPQIKAKLAELQRNRDAAHAAKYAPKRDPRCDQEPSRLEKMTGRGIKCDARGQVIKD